MFVFGFGWQAVKGYRRTVKDFKENKNAAAKGVKEAQNSLGVNYRDGLGVEQDFKEAVKWFEKAADQGAAMAQDNLGGMYGKGLGVEQNYVTAYTWASIAAFNGFEVAKETTSVIAKEMTSAQIAEAQKLSKEMAEKNPKLISKQQN